LFQFVFDFRLNTNSESTYLQFLLIKYIPIVYELYLIVSHKYIINALTMQAHIDNLLIFDFSYFIINLSVNKNKRE